MRISRYFHYFTMPLVADVNGKRRVYYQTIATKNGMTLHAVEVLAGRTGSLL